MSYDNIFTLLLCAEMTTKTTTSKKVDDRDENGWTPLHHAARNRDLLEVKRLLVDNADVNAKTSEFYSINDIIVWPNSTPLHIAASFGFDGSVSCPGALFPSLAPVATAGFTTERC